MTKETLLVVDDEPDLLRLLKRSLEADLGCRVVTAGSGEEAVEVLDKESVDLALVDIRMTGMDGLELLDHIRRVRPWLTVVMMTAHGRIEVAVQAIKAGAYDFITKPFDHEALTLTLNKALERCRLLRENLNLQKHVYLQDAFRNFVGKSAVMQRVFETIQMLAKTDLTVLITGESGTGKDLAARAVHALSDRRGGPFVPVNCPTVPENILESELFGYRKGAFTHAARDKIGLFQEAHRGTIFLDEIGDIGTTVQTKLLRVLQEKEIKPLGDTKSIRVDVRVISSTNRDLAAKIKLGEFREDLFYRLNVVPIELPPLRERRDDIPLIADHLLEKHCNLLRRPRKRLSPELTELFLRSAWVGNVRELENVVLRGILFAPDEEIRPEHCGLHGDVESRAPRCEGPLPDADLPYREAKEELLKHFHTDYISRVLTAAGGNVSRAARACGLERQALQQLMRKYGVKSEDYRTD